MTSVARTVLIGFGLAAGTLAAAAQTSPNGVVTPPKTQNRTGTMPPCANMDASGQPTTQGQVDANCGGIAAGAGSPAAILSKPETHPVTAVIRVNAAVTKPDKFPYPMDFQTVGDATMLKAKLPQVNACLGVAKSWAKRSNAATSVTCISHKGEVLAYQECKPAIADSPISCVAAEPGQTETASTK